MVCEKKVQVDEDCVCEAREGDRRSLRTDSCGDTDALYLSCPLLLSLLTSGAAVRHSEQRLWGDALGTEGRQMALSEEEKP